MLLLLIRHAETEHNIAGLLAGTTDSRLTTHGALQTQRLARCLVQERAIHFTHIFSSDLSRACLTADAIHNAQLGKNCPEGAKAERIVLDILREQDFGSLECRPWTSKSAATGASSNLLDPGHPDFKPKETQEAMATRMNTFFNETLLPLLAADAEIGSKVAVVSHGIILSVLWRTLLQQFGARSVSLGPEVGASTGSRPLESLPGWSNTGYLELDINCAQVRPDLDIPRSPNTDLRVPALSGYKMLIRAINRKDHLNNLKRTRGGLGSTAFDAKQKNLEGFFKKPKVEVAES
ncbi:hypothetical protein GJ744_008126 [Endocarpon pusillum]|uniref:Phosphoglycerate mutase family protein n=1 Tax=Endocarpon pusillum TaxID=364733 RepID=A0A8H7AHV6_9EURO|nr:hypothetical protein GJ744_008126 [Endocarpon pusillum]